MPVLGIIRHGNRLKELCTIYDSVEQVIVIPSSCFSPYFYTCLVGYLFDNIERCVADERHVCGSVLGSKPHQIVVEDHIHDPVQAIFDTPVGARGVR